jgi:AraC-like DNA-binding protein
LSAYFGDDYVDKDIRLEVAEPESFAASMEPFALGHVRGAIHVNNAPHRIFLLPCDTSCAGLDFYLMLSGEVAFECEEGPIRLRSGDMALLRAAEPLSSVSTRMDMIALHVPERLLRCRPDVRPLAIHQTISGHSGLGACLGALLRAAARRKGELSIEEGLILQSSVVDAVLHATAMNGEAADAAPKREAKMRLLKRSALNRLRDPELSPQRLSDETGISVRTVHRLFHFSGVSFRDWLRERRLERCWEELTEATSPRRSVADVAYRWGFNDLTTFNRSFRLKYGICPTMARSVRSLK